MDPALEFEQSLISRNPSLFEPAHRENSAIQRFYDGRVVFITGGSGFMGKLLIEKLFRTCEIKKMYVMIRPKKETMPSQRLAKTFGDPVFDGLKKMQPNFIDKIEAIEGDIADIRLGISESNWKKLTEEVDVIFHMAAVVRFDAPLKSTVLSNVRGTREALRLGKSCRSLRSFVYVSTAYSHATRSRIGTEISDDFHESPASPDALIQLVENLDEDNLKEVTPALLKDWPNTYSFSKAVAEEMIRITDGDLPICVVKPAIVIPTNREPVPGWIDMNCVFGPSGLLIGMGLGFLHVFFADVNIRVNIVPGDIATNAVIATGWETARRHAAGDKETKVYAVSNVRNPVKWGTIGDFFRGDSKKFMSPLVTYYPWGVETKSKLMFFIYSWLFHFIPAYIIDGVCMLAGKPKRFVKLYEKVYKMTTVFSYFNCNEWTFNDDNLRDLHLEMTDDDKEIFNVDLTDINWLDQMNIWIIGLRKYIVKDGLTGTNYALKKYFWLRLGHYILTALCLYSLWEASTWLYSLFSSFF
ncbi:PREDICTED: fatty acyl-CoA reductase 1-like [Papilio polytes]|uniref:fatty acyl-CoA reductase 1-like n=1 Tax=Papilio polytes TaxID=76194 RepID=UPI000675CB7B|nr:PREDICTED: fatty acyl-CoA reductase 1-like [Papilio polytes]